MSFSLSMSVYPQTVDQWKIDKKGNETRGIRGLCRQKEYLVEQKYDLSIPQKPVGAYPREEL